MMETPRPFGVFVKSYQRGKKYWFLNLSVPLELLPVPSDISPADLGKLLADAFQAERDRRHG